ncbi:MAG: dTDP-4-keto-6-deoxy-D-glucose epimerase, partial [Chitinophagaceae bacterium]
YGKHFSIVLSAENKLQLYVPRGFLHGFSVISKTAEFFYKCDNFYHKASEYGVRYDDADLSIDWNIDAGRELISEKDQILPTFMSLVNG